MLKTQLSIKVPEIRVKIPKGLLKEVAEKVITSINYRLFYKSMSGNGQLLEENEPGWLDVKDRFGFYLKPFAMTGAMTRRDAWEVRYTGNGVVIRLQDEHQKKWVTITDQGKINWNFAYTLGNDEIAAANAAIKKYLEHHINDIIEVSHGS